MKKFIFWFPRILAILFALYLSLFALDVFNEPLPFLELAIALIMHLLPTIGVFAILIFTWNYEWIGGTLFILSGVGYVLMSWGKFPTSTYLVIAGPLVVIGIFYWINWIFRKQIRLELTKIKI
ncbi:MAG: hypothetical protein K9J12_16340 [Melioribacteraceae bacterium]|nr:hypothetical protein [Melioribacteraceae bacterium]MCF8263978.1 hypothetical protein [Melioribacteraceae bacterium]MCF8413598.1 hypothetical protein [Melioribacteraceae bacterium]MCF8430735.1 hypothetical protein [Melioribacteraceae bacterium]